MGFRAGDSLTSGCDNVIIGNEALLNLLRLVVETFILERAGLNSCMCLCNVFIGAEAGKCSDGSYNVAIGLGAGKGSDTHPDNTGACNVSLGVCAGKCLVTGCDNVFIGTLAGECHCCGDGNTIIGHDAGKNLCDGDRNLFLGQYAGKGNSTYTSTGNIGIGCGLWDSLQVPWELKTLELEKQP